MIFDVALFAETLEMHIICNAAPLHTKLKFEDTDEWNCITVKGVTYDVHLLLDDDGWEVSIYPVKENGQSDYDDSQNVNLIVIGEYKELPRVDCVVAIYEWSCVRCQTLNKIIEWHSEVYCSKCAKKHKLELPEHSIG